MTKFEPIIAVGIGGALGAIFRMILSQYLPAVILGHFPLPIFLINVSGCFMMGVLAELTELYWGPNNLFKEFITTGFLSGFTTFSAFSLDYALMIERGFYIWALAYAFATFIGAIVACFAGLKIARVILSF